MPPAAHSGKQQLTLSAAAQSAGQSSFGMMRAVNSGLKSTSFLTTSFAWK